MDNSKDLTARVKLSGFLDLETSLKSLTSE